METYELYKRSLGLRYNEDRVHREIENGVSGYTKETDPEEGFELSPSDLYIEAASDDIHAVRLQEIEYELYEILKDADMSDESFEAYRLLEVEKTTLQKETAALEAMKTNLGDTMDLMGYLEQLDQIRSDALEEYLVAELREQDALGAPVDAEMYAEAELLATFISSANPDETSEGLVMIAKTIKEALEARFEYNTFLRAA